MSDEIVDLSVIVREIEAALAAELAAEDAAVAAAEALMTDADRAARLAAWDAVKGGGDEDEDEDEDEEEEDDL